jgi:site-specific recombinase XerD
MLKIVTPTRALVNWELYGYGTTVQRRTDDDADKLLEAPLPGKFIVTNLISGPHSGVVTEKPELQKIFENSSEDEKKAFKNFNDLIDGAEAERLSRIDLNRELEIWLGNITSKSTVKTYRCGVTKFLKWCETGKIKPFMIAGTQAREFQNWLKANGASNSVIRATIIACGTFFDRVFESHSISRPNAFKVKDLLPAKERVNKLFVPEQGEIDLLLTFTQKNLEVYTAIKLIIKYGMRIGAFEGMTVAGKKVVTTTKGKKMFYSFDDGDINLWRTCPLDKFTAKELGERVNYTLRKAYQEGMVCHRYSAHKLRHFFALKTLKESGGDVYTVSKGLGHRNLSTTGTYLEALDKEALSGETI